MPTRREYRHSFTQYKPCYTHSPKFVNFKLHPTLPTTFANVPIKYIWKNEISTLHRLLPVPLATLNLIPPPGYPNLDLMMASRGRNM